jgi:hypothetical protein
MVYCLKKSLVMRLFVVSAATAFTPFSQNSATEGFFESGQAHPGQSKPPGLFIRSNAFTPGYTAFSCRICLRLDVKADNPAAGLL